MLFRIPLSSALIGLVGLITLADASSATLTVGPNKTYARPCAAYAAAAAGDTIEISGGTTYSGDVCAITTSNLTIRGVNGRPIIDAAGQNALGKGTWVISGNNIVIENVEMRGATVPDQNGAALRLEGINFTLRGSFLHDNENGILSGVQTASAILIETTEFGHNGFGTGYTHNLYIGNAGSLTFRYNYSHDANVGHNLKSRAQRNLIAYNRFSSTPPGQTGTTASGAPSYEVDLPNAGTSYIIGNIIEQPSANNNSTLLAYGEEGASNPGKDLYVVNNTFLNDDSSSGTFINVGGGVTTPILMQNNIFSGVGTATNQPNAIDRSNYRSLAPAFVDRASYNLTPAPGAVFIDAGTAPGNAADGTPLTPTAQYRHPTAFDARPVNGPIDIGAYESGAAGSPTPTPAPAPTTGWTNCAVENGTCSFSGTRQVRYGANSSFVTRTATGSIGCNNSVFGDPIVGVAKSCDVSDATVAPVTETWTACAAEGGNCNFSGTRSVRYGANGYYAKKTATATVACTNAVFGDPLYGTIKGCSYSSISQ